MASDNIHKQNAPAANRPRILAADEEGIACVANFLLQGEIAALPTETVYGLAADARNARAVASIYSAKGRPDFNPLIVHVPNIEAAQTLAIFSDRAARLANAFWPGPLTLVLPRRADSGLAPAVTAGLPTVAVRMPAHPVMRAVLTLSGLALAAPSANSSGGISPSCAEHVAKSLGDKVGLILDGGPCARGLESTIIAVRDKGWSLLRPGPITAAMVKAELGEDESVENRGGMPKIEAPGQMLSHYAPSKPLRLECTEPTSDEWMIGFGAIAGDDTLSATGDLEEAARRLYTCLHQGDESEKARIAVAPIPRDGVGLAVNDRLNRAAAPR